MKKNIHPHYHTITVVLTDGEKIQTRSTWGKEGDTMPLDICPRSHVAWTKKQSMVEKGRAALYSQRFPGLNKLTSS